jgi:co-chaperonin GroES (HSP10)
MATQFEARQMQVRPLSKDILVCDMDMGEQVTAGGIVIKSDDGKAHGVRPRWARVYKVGDSCELDVKVGEWILIEHGRWTRKIKIDDGENIKEIQKRHSTQ